MSTFTLNRVTAAMVAKFKDEKRFKHHHPGLWFKIKQAGMMEVYFPPKARASKKRSWSRRPKAEKAAKERYSFGEKTCDELILEMVKVEPGITRVEVQNRIQASHPNAIGESIRGAMGRLIRNKTLVYGDQDRKTLLLKEVEPAPHIQEMVGSPT